jgi:predicted short-subunit dehydrogenase-like oxidoreductase (DUF2520 family)
MKAKLTFIGSGNVATNLAHAFYQAGHTINQVVSRNVENAKELASNFGAYYGSSLSQLYNDSDFILICVNDEAYKEVIASFPLGLKSIICHTSGAVNADVLEPYGAEFGVLYPLQSMTKENKVDFLSVPVFVEGSTTATKQKLWDLADSISNKVDEVNSEDRLRYHLAAVFANNFTNLMYVLADGLLTKHNLRFEYLLPIIEQSAKRLHHHSPEEVQTGPAKRGDVEVIKKHLELIENEDVKKVYQELSNFIMTKL